MKDIAEVFKFINYYALSKVWYKCNSIDIRVRKFNNIFSKVKAWLYGDQLEKPEECIVFSRVGRTLKIKIITQRMSDFYLELLQGKFKEIFMNIYIHFPRQKVSLPK